MACWGIFMIAALKSRLDNSSIWFISMQMSITFSHSFFSFPGSWRDRILYCCLGHVGYSARRLSNFVNFVRKSHCLGLAHGSLPSFVSCGSNNNAIFSGLVVLFLPALFIWCCYGSHCPCYRAGWRGFLRPNLLVPLSRRLTHPRGTQSPSWHGC